MGAFPSLVQTSLGQTFHLTKQIGQGGEGAIFEIREQTDVALNFIGRPRQRVAAAKFQPWRRRNGTKQIPS
jgi:hypothetical protein